MIKHNDLTFWNCAFPFGRANHYFKNYDNAVIHAIVDKEKTRLIMFNTKESF